MFNFRETAKLTRDQQQENAIWHYTLFSSHVCLIVTPLLVFAKCKPNSITLSMLVFGVIGGIFISLGNDIGFLLGTLFFVLLNIADTSDGDLARITSQTTKFGEYLDRLCHYFTNTIFCFCAGHWPIKVNFNRSLFVFGDVGRNGYALNDAC